MKISRRTFVAGGAAALAAPAMLRSVAYAQGDGTADVIVLGAGLSGLSTAALLEEQGLRVTVIEGRNRIGGRLYTRRELPGYPEFGGNSAAPGYGRWLAYASKCKLPLDNVAPHQMKNADQVLVIDGKIVKREDWPNHPRNPFKGTDRATMPWAYAGRAFSQVNPLHNYPDWIDPANKGFDLSVNDYLLSKGFDQATIDLAFDAVPNYGDTSHDVSTLMLAFIDAWTKAQIAAANIPASYAIRGGNQQLPEAMAKLLKGPVRLGQRVVAIDTSDTGATVTLESGEKVRAKAVVSSLPFSSLRNVHVSPGFTGVQHEAIQQLGYQNITLMVLVPKKPFWKEDGMGASMWTDGPAGWLNAQRFGKTTDDVTGFLVYGRGRLGLQWDRMGHKAAGEMVVKTVESFRPAAKGNLTVAAVHSWTQDPWNCGDWAIFRPGQVSRFIPAMSQPHQRLFLCGEHTGIANRGMESALESAERVSIEVLNTLE